MISIPTWLFALSIISLTTLIASVVLLLRIVSDLFSALQQR